ncbi:hypothetical protein [Streptomyces sp. NPDC056132]|uniref:hypothetical protein n=1 Tax=Streptomyces sp. NPDC056132 TaxID=3345722 RepID=UPI0035DBB5B6
MVVVEGGDVMGWVDREHIPTLQQDWRYGRLLNLTRRLLEERVPQCGNCADGTITVTDGAGNTTPMTCGLCQGTGETPTPVDNEQNGQASGGR